MLQNLRLPLAEIPDAEEGDGVGRGKRKEGDEQDAHENSKDTLDLSGLVRRPVLVFTESFERISLPETAIAILPDRQCLSYAS